MNKDQVGEDVTLWPLELCFCCFPRLFFFLEQRNNVVEKWVPDTLGKWDTVKRIKETKTIAVIGSKLKAAEARDKRRKLRASKMTEPWEGRRGRWFTMTFERHWFEYLLACCTLLGLGELPLFSEPFPSFKAINRKRAWKMATDAWSMVFESESDTRLWLQEADGMEALSPRKIVSLHNQTPRGNAWLKCCERIPCHETKVSTTSSSGVIPFLFNSSWIQTVREWARSTVE